MKSIAYIPGSDESANASLMMVTQVRTAPASTITVNTVAGAPSKFFASMGTPHTFIDPVTGEEITVISEATCVDFAGHIDSGKVEIDAISPGYSDLGSKVGDIIVIRPTTDWANNIHNILSESLDDDGKIKDDAIDSADMFADPVDPVKRASEIIYDHISSGLVWTGDGLGSNRNASMTGGIVYINGKRLTVAPVSARTFTASRDTYVDVVDAGDGTGTVVYTEGTNNSASQALAANSIRVAIIVTGASTIANNGSINQGQEWMLLPIASSRPYAVTDSIGNLICPRDPFRKLLGYRRLNGSQGSVTSEVVIAGLSTPIIIPAGRKIRLTLSGTKSNSASSTDTIRIRENSISGTVVADKIAFTASATASEDVDISRVNTPASQNMTYVVTMAVASGTLTANSGMALAIELE